MRRFRRRLAGDRAYESLERAGLRVLSGRPLGFWQRRAGLEALASDIDENASVAAVWLVRHLGSPRSTGHMMHFERVDGGWQHLGWGGGSAKDVSLAGRPSAAVAGASAILTNAGSCDSRSRADRNAPGGELDFDRVGWVASAAFRVATETAQVQIGARRVAVPEHGYVIVAWKAPPSPVSPARPPILALAADGSKLTELGPGQHMDSRTWADIEAVIAED